MENTERELKDRVGIVTGAGRGIGRAIAQQLAASGIKVVVADQDVPNARDTAERLNEKYGESIATGLDVTDQESVNSMVKLTLEYFGKLDILVNNAGIMFRTRLLDISLGEWERTLRVNLTGPFNCIKAVIPIMKENRRGRIINISSSAGRSVSTLGGAHYTASKAGLLGLTRAAAKEVASFGITVNAVCPGLFDTKMVRDTTTKKELEAFIRSYPIRRIGLPEEIGDLVVFLCSDKASYITGATIDINGGDLMI